MGTRKETERRDNIISYKTKKGDDVLSIAEKFEITPETIRWANDIEGNSVKEGKEILILPVTGVIYYIERGDTVEEIAKIHEARNEDVVAFNNISSSALVTGERIIVPGGKPPPPPPPPKEKPSSPPSSVAKSSPSPSTPAPSPPSSASAQGSFINPVPGGLITQGTHTYNAVDIYNPCGYPIVASASGRVIEVGMGTWPSGNFIKIDHGSMVILYSHMQDIHVSNGQQVSQGQQVGTVGNTGRTVGRTGCHLHFDVLSRKLQNPFGHLPAGTRLE